MSSALIKHGPVTPVRFLKLSATPIAPPAAPAPPELPTPTTFDDEFARLIKPSRPAVPVRKAMPTSQVVRVEYLNRYSQGRWG